MTRAALDGVGKNLADKRPRLVEVRAFSTGDDIVSRQISLAPRRWSFVAYLIDARQARIDRRLPGRWTSASTSCAQP